MDTIRIAYLYHWDTRHLDGVTKKIQMQVALWTALGGDIQTYEISAEVPARPTGTEGPDGAFRYSRSILDRMMVTTRAYRAILKQDPDLVYMRYTPLLPPPIKLLKRIPTVVEVNSDDRAEYRLRGRAKAQYNRAVHPIIARGAAGVVGVTPTLTRQFLTGAPNAVGESISNGINLSSRVVEHRRRPSRPRLVFMGSGDAPWGGEDKIPVLAAQLPEYDFDVIGGQLPLGTPVPENVFTHPFLSQVAYQELLQNADVGLGPMALHRKGMEEASPLKVREYLAAGLPVALPYSDPDFADRPWYTVRLPNTASPGALVGALRQFVEAVAGRRVTREELHNRIDATEKERQRLAFLLEVHRRWTTQGRWRSL